MKKDTHPKLYETEVRCMCGSGNVFTTLSTRETISVEICSSCHPAWTGEASKLMDSDGQVAKFNKRFQNLNFKK